MTVFLVAILIIDIVKCLLVSKEESYSFFMHSNQLFHNKNLRNYSQRKIRRPEMFCVIQKKKRNLGEENLGCTN